MDIVNWGRRISIKRVEHYTQFLYKIGIFNKEEKEEILGKIHHYQSKEIQPAKD